MAETSDSSRASSRLHSASRLCTRRASSRSANRVAPAAVVGSAGRSRAAVVTSFDTVLPRSVSRRSSGPLTSSARIWLMAVMRPCLAERRATRKARIASTAPFRVFGCPAAWPDCAARAAATASTGSDLPWLRRSWRLGRFTSTTLTPLGVQEARESRSVAAGPFDADTLDRTESAQPGEQSAVAGRGRRERAHSEFCATLVEHGDDVLVAVRVGAGRDAPGGLCHGGHRHPFS